MDKIIVTAYYPVNTGKHSHTNYNEWISNFFQCVTSPIIFFCSSEMIDILKRKSNSNVTFVGREFNSWEMMKESRMPKWREYWNVDPEKNIHSPELYAIWATKQEFVREAIKLIDSKLYIWCDAGYFRTVRECSFKTVGKYTQPSKITCLYVGNVIGGGMIVGDPNAWEIFSQNYLDELNKNINGKEQDIYIKIVNNSNAVIVTPTKQYGDPWFYLSYIFSV